MQTFLLVVALEDALGGRDVVCAVAPDRLADGQGEGLERGLGAVVVVLALEDVDMEGQDRVGCKGGENVRDHLGGELADHLAAQAQVDAGVRPARDVDDGAGQRLVERGVGGAEAGDALALAERAVKRLAERDGAVLGAVVVVNVQVALAGQREVHAAVLGQLREHVVQEADARVHDRRAAPVQRQLHRHVRLLRRPPHRRRARLHFPEVRR